MFNTTKDILANTIEYKKKEAQIGPLSHIYRQFTQNWKSNYSPTNEASASYDAAGSWPVIVISAPFLSP